MQFIAKVYIDPLEYQLYRIGAFQEVVIVPNADNQFICLSIVQIIVTELLAIEYGDTVYKNHVVGFFPIIITSPNSREGFKALIKSPQLLM